MKAELETLAPMSDTPAHRQSLGARIKEARKARGMSQPQLATAVGVSSQAVGQWERGTTSPTHDRLERLAVVLDRSLVWLLSGSDVTATEEAVRQAVEAYSARGIQDEPGALDASLAALAAVTTFDRLKAVGSLTGMSGTDFWRECVANYDILRAALVEFGSGAKPRTD